MPESILGNLGPLIKSALQSLSSRRVVDSQGNTVTRISPYGDAAANLLQTTSSGLAASQLFSDLKKKVTDLEYKAAENALVKLGLTDRASAAATVRNLPAFLLNIGGQTTGYPQALKELETFVIQEGYRDPASVPEQYRSEQLRLNSALESSSRQIFEYIRPDNPNNQIAGIRPDTFVAALRTNPQVLRSLTRDRTSLTPEGTLTPSGEAHILSDLNEFSSGIREIMDITGTTKLEDAIQVGSEMFGTSPMEAVTDPQARKFLKDLRATSQQMGFTLGDTQSLLTTVSQIGQQQGKTLAASLGLATGVLPLLRPSYFGRLTEAQKRSYFGSVMEKAANPGDYKPTRAESAVYAAFRATGTSKDNARRQVSNISRDARSPTELLRRASVELKPYLTFNQSTVQTFLDTPEAAEYLNSPEAARNAVLWSGRESRKRTYEALLTRFGRKKASTIMSHSMWKVPTEDDAKGISEYVTSNLDQQVRIAGGIRKSVAEAARKGGMTPTTLQTLSRASVPRRVTSAPGQADRIRGALPESRPSSPGTNLFQGLLTNKDPFGAFLGQGADVTTEALEKAGVPASSLRTDPGIVSSAMTNLSEKIVPESVKSMTSHFRLDRKSVV